MAEPIQSVIELRQALEQQRGRLQHIRDEAASARTNLATLEAMRIRLERVQAVYQIVAQETQGKLTFYINDMVTSAIDLVFPDDDWMFCLEFVQRRGTTEADIYLGDAQGNRIKPRDAEGGGLINVAAFVLRVALWSLRKNSRPVFILDEPFHFLHSTDAHARVAELLATLAQRLNLQIIMVTGEEESAELIAGASKVIRVKKIKGISHIRN